MAIARNERELATEFGVEEKEVAAGYGPWQFRHTYLRKG